MAFLAAGILLLMIMKKIDRLFDPDQTVPSKYPRKFLPEKLSLVHWKELEPFARDLIERRVESKYQFKRWLNNYSEFINAVYDWDSRLYIATTCDTADKTKSESYLNFKKEITQKLEVFQNKIDKKIIIISRKKDVIPKKHTRWVQSLKSGLKLYNEKNLGLISEISTLVHEYHKMCGDMLITWKGKKRTVTQMNKLLESPVRNERMLAWKKTWSRYIQDRPRLDKTYNNLLRKRYKTAENLGFSDYRKYWFKLYNRTDYTIDDCCRFHKTVEKVAVPMYLEILKYRKNKLKIKNLRPWDMACDMLQKKSSSPFKNSTELIKGVKKILNRIDPQLGEIFGVMQRKNLLDLDNRAGKRGGGYQIFLDEMRMPFIFMNSTNSLNDVFTLLHESGHASHQFLSRKESVPFNREAPMEFCEVASMSLEKMGIKHLEAFYSREDTERAVCSAYEEVFRLLAWVCIVDKFQHWIYTHPRHTNRQRNKVWLELMETFQPGLDWSGITNFRKTAWHRQLHIFQYPFYYIEYGIALIGSLQMWVNYRKNPAATVRKYKSALKAGGKLGLKQLFTKAGLKFDFSPATVKPLLELLFQEWKNQCKK